MFVGGVCSTKSFPRSSLLLRYNAECRRSIVFLPPSVRVWSFCYVRRMCWLPLTCVGFFYGLCWLSLTCVGFHWLLVVRLCCSLVFFLSLFFLVVTMFHFRVLAVVTLFLSSCRKTLVLFVVCHFSLRRVPSAAK